LRLADPAALKSDTSVRAVLEALTLLRGAGLRVWPNHVFAGQQSKAIAYSGCPRLMGGPGTLVLPAAEPSRVFDVGATDGHDVTIALLDTGVWAEHPWLGRRVVVEAKDDETEWDEDRDTILDAQAGHGTFLAGLILQLAPGVSVLARKVLDSHGVTDDLAVARAVDALPAGVDVINLSLGGYTELDAAPPALTASLRKRIAEDTVVVAAAGNDGKRRKFWPAAVEEIVSVGALEHDGRAASFSNFGAWVRTCAPGVDLVSSFLTATTSVADATGRVATGEHVEFAGWSRWGGTSMAAPLVAGAIALVMTSGERRLSAPGALERLIADFSSTAPTSFPNGRRIDFDRLQGLKRDRPTLSLGRQDSGPLGCLHVLPTKLLRRRYARS
jgi:subtilisin family serine protease